MAQNEITKDEVMAVFPTVADTMADALGCDVEDIKITTKPGPHHVALLGRGIPLVEYPVNLDQLTKDRVFICAAPINIRGCDGAPVRIVAIEEI